MIYDKGTPWINFRAIQEERTGTQLRPKIDGKLGKASDDKCVLQGIPHSAQLSTIYFDAILNEYGRTLPGELKQVRSNSGVGD